ncbi:hypothetical protein [Flaviaesturariibacter amylovorans]|uniref:Uncharacterized protein n=1 Tax=Flaviaesturariibacter amylovorans TaxID=1084520 RepID=A0ABP8HUK8_9BACT
MKQLLPFLLLFALPALAGAQKHFYDTKEKHYARIDFSYRDDLSKWRYAIDTARRHRSNPSLGTITFWRTEPIKDSTSRPYAVVLQPRMAFEIYALKDSALARRRAKHTRAYTDCLPPEGGGDYFTLGAFAFANTQACLSTYYKATRVDYGRSAVNVLFGAVDPKDAQSLFRLIKQLKALEAAPPGK